ncbi:MAG: aminotransferase class V-fold PLP-dependent enzyme, partial [Longimicrobiales bacterium]
MPESGASVYLDYAATSAVRPEPVIRAVADYLRTAGGTPGRGGHRLAIEAGRVALRCRLALADLLGLPGDPGRICFMLNATHALNTALAGVLGSGDVVVVTQLDHNAVLRPVHRLALRANVTVRMVEADRAGTLDDAGLERALDGARLLVVNAASNVLGTSLDVAGLARRARSAGALVLVDLAQAAGHLPFNAASTGVDMVAITGHKALLGPQGIGALWVREGIEVEPFLTGGTGGDSRSREMPVALPDRLEAGTVNAPGIAGLLAGIEWLRARGVGQLRAHAATLKQRLYDGLAAVPGVRVVSPPAPDGVAIVTVVADATDPSSLSARLDQE